MTKIINEYALESVNQVLGSIDSAKEKMKLQKILMEAVTATPKTVDFENKAKLIEILYKDILTKDKIDYGTIPNSQGNVLKYTGYDSMAKSMDILNRLLGNKKLDDIELMNLVNDMLIKCRADFEFGFKNDLDIIKTAYNVLVVGLQELININIVTYVDYLKSTKDIDLPTMIRNKKNRPTIFLTAMKTIVNTYATGEWNQFILYYKKNLHTTVAATEAVASNCMFTEDEMDSAMEGISFNPNSILDTASKFISSKDASGNPKSRVFRVTKGAIIGVVSLVVLVMAIRMLVYFFYNGSVKLSDWAKNRAEFIEAYVENEKTNGMAPDSKPIVRQTKHMDTLNHIHDVIETRILKTTVKTERSINEGNRNIMTVDNIQQPLDSDNGGIEIL